MFGHRSRSPKQRYAPAPRPSRGLDSKPARRTVVVASGKTDGNALQRQRRLSLHKLRTMSPDTAFNPRHPGRWVRPGPMGLMTWQIESSNPMRNARGIAARHQIPTVCVHRNAPLPFHAESGRTCPAMAETRKRAIRSRPCRRKAEEWPRGPGSPTASRKHHCAVFRFPLEGCPPR